MGAPGPRGRHRLRALRRGTPCEGRLVSAPGHARVAVVVGNPKPASRTLDAATYVATELGGRPPDLVVDLATLGAGLLDWADPTVDDLVSQVSRADLVVVASPTYKATYSGLLKLFLDRFTPARGTGLHGTAVPLMLGAGPAHALAPELTLRPLLAEIGAPVSLRGLYVLDSAHDDPAAYADWLASARPVARALLAASSELSTTGVPA
nr:NAD(P)H-dependent oxidoreductase [Nocardioides lijunqiniae]